jgi:hypothetical protein
MDSQLNERMRYRFMVDDFLSNKSLSVHYSVPEDSGRMTAGRLYCVWAHGQHGRCKISNARALARDRQRSSAFRDCQVQRWPAHEWRGDLRQNQIATSPWQRRTADDRMQLQWRYMSARAVRHAVVITVVPRYDARSTNSSHARNLNLVWPRCTWSGRAA